MGELDKHEINQIIQSMSKIYTSAYYIDLVTNEFTELSSLAEVRTHIGASGNAQERLNYFCHHMITSDFLEELLEFTDLSTLDERMKDTRIISKQYQSTLFVPEGHDNMLHWGQCSFIEGDRDAQGKLTHVVFATQSIHETKVKELEAQRKLQETNRELTALLEAEQRHTAIIGSLSSVFFAMYFIDLEENTFQELIAQDSMHHLNGQIGDPRQSLKLLLKTHVENEYQPVMRIFLDLDTLDTRLRGKSIIIQDFLANVGGWNRCSFIPVERTGEGKLAKVLCGLRVITAEKEQLATQDNLILALSMSYENVYAVNMDTGVAVCYRMGQTMSDRYGEKFAVGDYEKNICSYINNDVHEDDRHLFDEVRTIAGIDRLFADKKAMYFNYRVNRNGKVEYYQCQIVKPRKERNEFAIGFKNIDERK